MNDDEQDERDPHRCGPCGRRVSQGWTLCNRCSEKLGDNLLEIAERYQHLTAASGYEPGRYDHSGGGKPGSKPPGRTDVMALRDFRSGQSEPTTWRGADGRLHSESDRDTPAVLRAVLGWCQTIGEERGFTTEPWTPSVPQAEAWDPPSFTMADHDEMTGYVDPTWHARRLRYRVRATAELITAVQATTSSAARVVTACRWLSRQDDWIARWHLAGEQFDNVKLLRNRLRAATGEPNPRPLANCIRFVERPGAEPAECGALVFPPAPDPTAPSYLPVVRCTGRDRHEYSAGDITRLVMANEQTQRKEATG